MQPKLPAGCPIKPLQYQRKHFDGRRRKPKFSTDIQANLKTQSQWWKSIKDPLHGASCKIPDDNGIETGTFQCALNVTFTSKANVTAGTNFGGVQLFSPYPGISTTNPSGQNYQFLDGATSNNASMNWDAAVYALPTNVPLNEYSQGVRVVSAAVYVESEASLSSSSGEFCCFISPWDYFGSGIPYDDYANNYGSGIMPLNRTQPMKASWFPCNKENSEYNAFYNCQTNATLGFGDGDQRPWSIGIISNGAPDGTVFRAIIVVNYEFIPHQNAVDLLSAKPSRVDVVEQQLVETWVQDEPKAEPVTASTMSASPSAVTETPNPTGFGMFADVVKELIPYGLEVASDLF